MLENGDKEWHFSVKKNASLRVGFHKNQYNQTKNKHKT